MSKLIIVQKNFVQDRYNVQYADKDEVMFEGTEKACKHYIKMFNKINSIKYPAWFSVKMSDGYAIILINHLDEKGEWGFDIRDHRYDLIFGNWRLASIEHLKQYTTKESK